MNHNIITTSSMIQNRDNQPKQSLNQTSANTKKINRVRTLQMLLTTLTMLFELGVNGASINL